MLHIRGFVMGNAITEGRARSTAIRITETGRRNVRVLKNVGNDFRMVRVKFVVGKGYVTVIARMGARAT